MRRGKNKTATVLPDKSGLTVAVHFYLRAKRLKVLIKLFQKFVGERGSPRQAKRRRGGSRCGAKPHGTRALFFASFFLSTLPHSERKKRALPNIKASPCLRRLKTFLKKGLENPKNFYSRKLSFAQTKNKNHRGLPHESALPLCFWLFPVQSPAHSSLAAVI